MSCLQNENILENLYDEVYHEFMNQCPNIEDPDRHPPEEDILSEVRKRFEGLCQ